MSGGFGGGGGWGGLINQVMSQLPHNMQNYVGGPQYPGMTQQDAQPFGTPGAGAGSYNQLAGDMSQQQFGQSSFSPTSGFAYSPYQAPPPTPWGGPPSWPGFGMGGMPGRFGNPRVTGYGGAFGGGTYGGYGFPRGNMYGPGSHPPHSAGSMGFGGGSGMQAQRTVAPAQQVQQFLNYRSPYSGGGQFTQYGPQMMTAQY